MKPDVSSRAVAGTANSGIAAVTTVNNSPVTVSLDHTHVAGKLTHDRFPSIADIMRTRQKVRVVPIADSNVLWRV